MYLSFITLPRDDTKMMVSTELLDGCNDLHHLFRIVLACIGTLIVGELMIKTGTNFTNEKPKKVSRYNAAEKQWTMFYNFFLFLSSQEHKNAHKSLT